MSCCQTDPHLAKRSVQKIRSEALSDVSGEITHLPNVKIKASLFYPMKLKKRLKCVLHHFTNCGSQKLTEIWGDIVRDVCLDIRVNSFISASFSWSEVCVEPTVLCICFALRLHIALKPCPLFCVLQSNVKDLNKVPLVCTPLNYSVSLRNMSQYRS